MEKIIKKNSLNIKCLLSPNNKKSLKKDKKQMIYEFINENKRAFSICYKNKNNLNFTKGALNLKLSNAIYLLLLSLLFTNLIFIRSVILRKYNNEDSEIELKIKGTGVQNIIGTNFDDIPNKIVVNG